MLELVQAGATEERCSIHTRHEPLPRYVEHHHLVPKAWQTFWRPAAATAAVWDNRTVPLCRTGHGNVHWWIVAYMLAFEAVGIGVETIDDVFESAHATHRHQVGKNVHERKTAQLALTRWLDVGGSLTDLVDAGLYGGI